MGWQPDRVDLNSHDILAELTDELIHHGDPNSALRNLLQNGFEVDGERIQGVREMLKQLAEERAQRLENHDLGGVYDEIADELSAVQSTPVHPPRLTLTRLVD